MMKLICCPKEDELKKALFEHIKSDLDKIRNNGGFPAENGSGNTPTQVILIVPAQFTLEAEKAAFEALGGPGFFDLHIMSGNKLREEILNETGGPGVTPINTIGRSMLLRRIAAEKGDSLKAFAKVCKRPEFLDLAADFIVQLKQNRLRPEDLGKIRSGVKPDSLLFSKLSDMEQLCSAYDEAMAGRFTDSESMLRFTAEKIPESKLVARSVIWYYDFYSFTPNEIAFLGQLMKHSAGLGVALLHCENDERFAVTLRTVQKLAEEAKHQGIEMRRVSVPVSADHADAPKPHIVRCSTPHTQAQTIAARVMELIRTGKASADQIAILTGDMEGCGSEIRRVFTQLGIPLFMDEKRSVRHDPAIALVSSLLDMSADGLRRDHVSTFLKTGLTGIMVPGKTGDGLTCKMRPLDAKKTDDFENYCKQYHISHERFLKPLKYGKKGLGEAHFNGLEETRAAVAAALTPYLDSMKAAKTVRQRTETLCRFLTDDLKLPERLENCALSLGKAGLADASEEIGQMWQVITGLMDQAVELMGDVEMDDAEFRKLYQDAFSDIKVGLLPQQTGRVTLGTINRSKLSNVKALFVAGTNEGQIPSDQNGEMLLTEDELELLAEQGYILSKSSTVLAEEEKLNIYKAFSSPTDYFWIGYCMEDSSAAAVRPSPLVLDMAASGIKVENDIENNGVPEDFLTGRHAATEELGRNLRSLASGEIAELPEIWKRTYNMLLGEENPDLDSIRRGLLFSNEEKPLGKNVVRQLYSAGATEADKKNDVSFNYSASALEKYAGCAFRHFVSYALKPDEPRELEVGGAEIGDIYHECLMVLSAQLSLECREKKIAVTSPGSPWMTISREDLKARVGEILDRMSEEKLEGFLKDGPDQVYRSSRIREIALRFAWQMVLQLRRGNIDAMKVETPFGYDNAPSVNIETPAGTVHIVGRIDRMDISGDLLKIIDYKSGNTKFDRKEVEEGYALQLMVYLESALEIEKNTEPAGMFYYRIGDHSIDCTLEDISADTISAELLSSLENDYKLDGIYVADDKIVSVIDSSAVSSGQSDVINYKVRKDGTLSGKSGISREEFDQLRGEFRRAIERIVNELNSGRIEAHPHKKNRDSACTYCDYRGICIFDTAFASNSFK